MPDSTDASADIPRTGPLLGVDFGTRRVGLAISTGDQSIASPLETMQRQEARQEERYFRNLLSDYRIQGLVVGLPIHVGGEEGQKAREAREYGAWLHKISQLPVTFWDERYTSAVAEEYLLAAELTRAQRKKRIDKLAAQIFLQSFLDYRRQHPPEAIDA